MLTKLSKKLKAMWYGTTLWKNCKVSNPIKWGIIGLGYMGETFATAIDGTRDGQVVGVASRSISKAKSFAGRHGRCRAYGSYSEMLSDNSLDLDIVYIATPVKCHFDNIKMCLEAGKNVLCEKPIVLSSEEFSILSDLASKNGCFLMEGMWMKCLPTFVRANEWIQSGLIGDIELIKADFYKREHIRPDLAIYNAADGGGVIRDFGVYAISFMNHFMGNKLSLLNAQCRTLNTGIDTDWQIMAQSESIKAAINLSSDFGSLSKAAVIGSKGSIEWNSQFNRTNTVKLFDSMGIEKLSFSPKYVFDGFEYEIAEVQQCIRRGLLESPLVPLSKTLETIKIIEKVIDQYGK